MTEQLKTLMDRAAAVDFATVDLEAITSAGDRTVRRRRIGTGVAGVAVFAVIGATAALVGGNGDQKADFSDDPFRTDVPMWTEGSVLHTPDATYDLGVDVATFVRTSEGIAFLGWDGNRRSRFEVYTFAGEGEPTQIGVTQDSRLRTDPGQPYVGWLDGTGHDVAAVVYDASAGKRVLEEPTETAKSFPVVAIDGTRAYLADVDEGPTHVVDLVSGDRTDLPDTDVWRNFVDVEGDLVARKEFGIFDRGDTNAVVVGSVDDPGAPVPGEGGVLSPGGRWLSTFHEGVEVYGATSGEPIDVDAGGYANGFGYDWLDDDTLLALAGTENGSEMVLFTCEIPSGDCEQVVSLGGFDDGKLRAISFGESIWGVAASEASGSLEATTTSTALPE